MRKINQSDWSTPHQDTEAQTFIQWKNTDVCMELYCPCGNGPHVDGYLAYFVRCSCGKIYQLGYQVQTRVVSAEDLEHDGINIYPSHDFYKEDYS